jgi:hypothetical protein
MLLLLLLWLMMLASLVPVQLLVLLKVVQRNDAARNPLEPTRDASKNNLKHLLSIEKHS